MAWKTIDRTISVREDGAKPVLDEAVRENIRSFFPRYPTRRAVVLPALHVVQNALGHVSYPAMMEVAELLELPPSAIINTLSFYTHFWTHTKGEKVIVVCRSISCQLLGADRVLDAVKETLGIDEHGTTPDGKYSLMTEECLAGCDHAPCMLINEKLHKCVRPEDGDKILADENNAMIDVPRSDLFDAPTGGGSNVEAVLGSTSDVSEMKEAE